MLSTKLKEAAGNGADATLYVDDVFSTYLYTGDGSTSRAINNGIDLATKGGLVWTKDRTQAQSHEWFDTARGVTKSLSSDTTNGQLTSTNYMKSFAIDGYTIGDGSEMNLNGDNFVSWTFRKAAKFFDVVTYTGNGGVQNIAHSLGVAPGMIIVKKTTDTGNWRVYSNGMTSADYSMQLNRTNAQTSDSTVWNSTAPTSSVFSVGTNTDVNDNSQVYVAYLFAHDTAADGIIQCGSFTADGTGTGTVTLGWEPQYIMVKKINASNNWVIDDSMRGWNVSGQDSYLLPNSYVQEGLYEGGYPTATGFVNLGGYSAGDNLIYMAIRMPNKPPTSGAQVYNAIARTGTGAAATVTGVGFSADGVFCHARANDGVNAGWFDRLRGTSNFLISNSTGAEVNNATELTALNMDGYSVGSSSSGYKIINYSAYTYVNWLFKRAPEFFDEVCYTGGNYGTITVNHNLTVIPELVIFKNRSVSADWLVGLLTLTSGGTRYAAFLNKTNPAFATGALPSSPTAATLTIGTGIETNDYFNPYTYVAYLFATLAGISKVGSYTGNGSTGQAIACGFSAGARFVLIKRTDSTGDWYTFDSARGLTSGSSPYVLLNSTAAETTGNNGVYASTGGFTLATSAAGLNASGGTYIFLAVA